MKRLIIGEALSEPWYSRGTGMTGRPVTPLDGPGGKRIADLIGATLEEFLDAYHRENVYRGPSPVWTKPDAARRASEIVRRYRPSRVICLGTKAGEALGISGFFRYDFYRDGQTSIHASVVPHPSGLSRWWNDSTNTERARVWWREEWASMKRDPVEKPVTLAELERREMKTLGEDEDG